MRLKETIYSKFPFFLLIVLAFFTRFYSLGYPSEVVFDEVHFGKFVNSYFNHQYYFDIHPPLGKLLIAGFAKLFGFQPNIPFSHIGEKVDPNTLLTLRFLPALFGSLLVLLIYQLALLLKGSKGAAFLAGLLLVFDNALLVQSKFILIDSFLLFFGILALYFFLLAKKQTNPKKERFFFVCSAIMTAGAFSIKWTGFAFWAIIVFLLLLDFFKERDLGRLFSRFTIFVGLPFLIYFLIFVVHFRLLFLSGPGSAFMSPTFQKTLQDNQLDSSIKPLSLIEKFWELNRAMFRYNSSLEKGHPDASFWYQWPMAKKPIWYWAGQKDNQRVNIYLLANPLVWWPMTLGLFFGLLALVPKKTSPAMKRTILLLLFGFLANLLPFIFVKRALFLYHYFPSLIFAIILWAIISDRFFQNHPYCFGFYLFLVFFSFLILAPQSYGLTPLLLPNVLAKILIRFLH